MALLFPNSVKVVISLNCGLTWSNSSVCFLRGRKSCLLAGLWRGHELEESPQCASLKKGVGVMGMDASPWWAHVVFQVRPGWRLCLGSLC